MYPEKNHFPQHAPAQTKPPKGSWQQYLPHESEDDDPFTWTSQDILTLLLIFFIMLYTTANARPTTAAEQSTSTQIAVSKNAPADLHDLNRLQEDVSRFMANTSDQGFSVRWEQKQPVFVLGENITFARGEAGLCEDFQPVLQEIASFIASKNNYRVIVSGHTDNTPITTSTYPSNWELSAARAAQVARFLSENGVAPEKIAIHGYAEYKPLFSNDSQLNRQANRRVEIKLGIGPD